MATERENGKADPLGLGWVKADLTREQYFAWRHTSDRIKSLMGSGSYQRAWEMSDALGIPRTGPGSWLRKVLEASVKVLHGLLVAEGKINPRATARGKPGAVVPRGSRRGKRLPARTRKKLAAMQELWANGTEQETIIMAIEQAYGQLVDAGEIAEESKED